MPQDRVTEIMECRRAGQGGDVTGNRDGSSEQ